MKAKHLLLAIVALLIGIGGVVVGMRFARPAWRAHAAHQTNSVAGNQGFGGPGKAPHVPRPPDPTRRFADFTPEERVEFARKGRGPGG